MSVHFDTSEIDQLAADLARAPTRLRRSARKTMKRTALEVKRRMKEDFSGHRQARGVPVSLEFKRLDGTGGLAYEIGELDSAGVQWGLAAILAYGTSNNAPVVDHTASLRGESPLMVDHLATDAEDSVLGGSE